jgi:hypothetical protein
MVPIYNPSTQEAETGGPQVQGQSQLYSKKKEKMGGREGGRKKGKKERRKEKCFIILLV